MADINPREDAFAMPPKPDDRDRFRMNILVTVFAILAVGLLYLLVEHIKSRVPPQDCHMAGFSSCRSQGPLITSPYRRDRLE